MDEVQTRQPIGLPDWVCASASITATIVQKGQGSCPQVTVDITVLSPRAMRRRHASMHVGFKTVVLNRTDMRLGGTGIASKIPRFSE